MSGPLRLPDIGDGYKMLLQNIIKGTDSLSQDFKAFDKANNKAHADLIKNLGDKVDAVKNDLNKFIQQDFHALEIKVLIRGAIAGLIPTIIGLIVGGITIYKFVNNALQAGTP